MKKASDFVSALGLMPHPEGGYYKEVYRSSLNLPQSALQNGFKGGRACSTAIYFLIESGNFSALHRIKSDEIWHFYAGDALEVIEIDPSGKLTLTNVGSHIDQSQCFQYTVKAGHWFGSRVKAGGSFSLVGCTVAPGFDFQDFEMADRTQLSAQFPQHSAVIAELTRKA